MSRARERASREGTSPVKIGTTQLNTDSGDLKVTDTSNNLKKVVADEIHIGDSSNKVIIKKGSDNKVQFQTQASGSSAADSNAGGVSVFADVNTMASASGNNGDLAYVTATKKLYVHNGGGWYSFTSELNTSPVISSPATGATITLGTDGTATTIQITATDADPGTTLQYSYAVTTGSIGSTATVTSSATSGGTYSALAASTNTTNTFFKITPSTNSAHAGTFSLTFSASDSLNAATTVQNFTLAFETFGSTSMQLNANYNTAGTDHIEVASHSDFTLGTNDFTIEGWFFFDGPPSHHDYPGSTQGHRGSVGYTAHLFDFREVDGPYSNKRAPMVYIGGSGGNNAQAGSKVFRYHVAGSDVITSSVQFPEIEVQWFHFAIVRNSGTTTMYINGVSEGTWSDSTNYDEIDKLWIGRHGYNANHNFLGWISNFRVVNGTAVYTANFTPPADPLTSVANTKLLICTKPDAVDDIGPTGHTVTKVGNATHAAFNPFGGTGYGALFFDKNNDNLKYEMGGGNAITGMGALTDLTFEAWVFHFDGHSDDTTDPNVETCYLHCQDQLSSGVQMTFGRTRTYSNTNPIFTSTHGHPYQNQVYTANAAHDVNRGDWYHVAFVKEGTNLRMYKNGTNVAGNNQTSSTSLPSSFRVGEITIGTTYGDGYDMLGYMSNVRISNSARYSADFTPSTTPLSSDSNTVLLTGQSPVPKVISNGSYHFTSNSTKLLATHADFNLASSTPFTVEMWYYLISAPANRMMWDFGVGNQFQLYQYSGNWYIYGLGGAYIINGTDYGMTLNRWYHVAVTGDGSNNVKLYFDGVQYGSTYNASWTITGGKVMLNGNLALSQPDAKGVEAYLSDFRVVNGTQVYTGAFTRPSGPLTTTGGTYPSNTNVNTSITASHTKILTCQNSSGAKVDNSASGHSLTAHGTVTPRAGVEIIAPDASSNNFILDVNGNTRNARISPFNYNG